MNDCSVTDCTRKFYARELCRYHYDVERKTGALAARSRQLVAAGTDLAGRLEHSGWEVTPSGCWEFSGGRNKDGYGQLAVGRYDGKVSWPMLASRAAYEAWIGPIPEGRAVCHECDNPPCINPGHFFLGTRGDNNRDAMDKGRTATWSRRPHKLTADQVGEVRAVYAAGDHTQREVAKAYGVSQQLVSELVRFKRRPEGGELAQ